MAGRNPINPLSILFVLGVFAYGMYNGWIATPAFLTSWIRMDGGNETGNTDGDDKTPAGDAVQDPDQTGPPPGTPATGTPTTGLPVTGPSPGNDDAERESAPQPLIISGRVVAILDGDTIEVLVEEKRQLRIRLDGIDAPEREQPYSRQARDYLGQLCHGQTAYIMVLAKDRYDRLIGDVYLENLWVNGEMVKAGYAWHYTRYSDSAELASLQQAARAARLGLWADSRATAPWDFRAAQR